MAELFEDGQDAAAGANGGENKATKVGVVRADRRKLLVWPGADGPEYLLTPDLHRKLQLQLAIMEPGHNSGDPYAHPVENGEEFGFIIEGLWKSQ